MNAPSNLKKRPEAVRDGPVFTTGEVALICRVAPRTVTTWADAGRLPGTYRIPGSNDRRIPREAVLRLLRDSGMPVPGWLTERPRLLALSASPMPWLQSVHLPGWDVEHFACPFAAGRAYAARRHAAVLLDFNVGRMASLCVARSLAAQDRPPLLACLVCDDESDRPALADLFGLTLDRADPAALAAFLAAREVP